MPYSMKIHKADGTLFHMEKGMSKRIATRKAKDWGDVKGYRKADGMVASVGFYVEKGKA